MKARGVLMLAAVLAVLCAAYWFMLMREQQVIVEQIEAKQLFSFEPESVTEIEIRRIGEDTTAVTRDENDQWSFTKPNALIKANQIVWDRVAKELSLLRTERTIGASPEELAAYGLEDPVLTLIAQTGEGPVRIDFGDIEPTQTYRYALHDNDTLMLVNNKKQFFELNRPLDDLRDRFLVDNREATILRFEFVRIFTADDLAGKDLDIPVGTEAAPITVERDDADSPWRMLEPAGAPADQEVVNGLLNEIQFAVGRNYDDDPESLQDYGLEPAAVRVTIVDDDSGKAQTVFFGHIDNSEDGGIYVKRASRPAVFTIDAHLLSLIPKSPTEFRAHQLLTQSATGLQSLDYEGPEGAFRLARGDDDSWSVVEPAMADVNSSAISNFIARLKRTEATEFLDGEFATFGLDDPEVKIVLTADDGTRGEIRLAPNPDDPANYFVTQDAGSPAILSKTQAEGLIVSPDTFRSRNLMRFDPAQAVQLKFRLDETEYFLDQVHDKWVVRQPAGMRLQNQSDVALILDAVTPLDALRPATAEDAADQGESLPTLSFRVTLRDDSGSTSELGPLRVGGVSAADSRYRVASAAGREGLWLIEPDVLEAFREAIRGVQPVVE